MERIIIVRRETKKDGEINLRLRLRDGRGVDLFHKTDIKISIKDLSKFEEDGSIRGKVTIYNRKFKNALDQEIGYLRRAYAALCERMDKTHISSELLEQEIAKIKGLSIEEPERKENMLDRFGRFIEEGYRDNYFNEKRMKHYLFVKDSVERFLIIKGLEKITPNEFTPDLLMEIREFFADEYKYVDTRKYGYLFKNIKSKRDIPSQRREDNTVVGRMKKLQAFFNELLDKEEIDVSPFQRLGRKRKAQVMKETYDDPRFLHKDEFLRILDTDVPRTLEQCRDAFLVQCSLGCRISDFKSLSMDKIAVTDDGIPYVHYLPQKTLRENTRKVEVETPILKFALEIIKKWNFNFPILNYAGGENGYNVKIRRLLEYCGIDRLVKSFNDETNDNEFHPIYEYGSSKLCRSTHVDMMRKVQVDLYVTGLHSAGSQAVHHYTKEELRDRFGLMCVAFGQPLYKVDKELNIIEDN